MAQAESSLPMSLTKRRYGRLKRPQRTFAYMAVTIPMLLLIVFYVVPAVVSLVLSVFNWSMLSPPKFAGLTNFVTLFRDKIFRKAWVNTTYYMAVCTVLQTVLGLAAAMLLTRPWLKAKGFFRVVFFVPVVLSMVSVALIWLWMLDARVGLINTALKFLRLPAQPWLNSTILAMPSMIAVSIWKFTGYNTVLFIAGLQGIPEEYYDAAAVDGADARQRFLHITLPMLRPTLLFVLITTAVGSFQVFDQIYIMTGYEGRPFFSTMVLGTYMYQHAFDGLRFGYACAFAVLMFAFLLILTGLQLRVIRTETLW